MQRAGRTVLKIKDLYAKTGLQCVLGDTPCDGSAVLAASKKRITLLEVLSPYPLW
jgi:hypothetical protein